MFYTEKQNTQESRHMRDYGPCLLNLDISVIMMMQEEHQHGAIRPTMNKKWHFP